MAVLDVAILVGSALAAVTIYEIVMKWYKEHKSDPKVTEAVKAALAFATKTRFALLVAMYSCKDPADKALIQEAIDKVEKTITVIESGKLPDDSVQLLQETIERLATEVMNRVQK